MTDLIARVVARYVAEKTPRYKILTALDETSGSIIEYLNRQLERFPKVAGGSAAWWSPPHNMALIHLDDGAWITSRFTIIPYPKESTYQEGSNGFNVKPYWTLALWGEKMESMSQKSAQLFVSGMKTYPSLRESMEKELSWIERRFKLDISPTIKSSIMKGSEKAAVTLMGLHYRSIHGRFVPLDGSLSQPVRIAS